MEKKITRPGITKPCPKCKRVLIKSATFTGTGSFYTKCPHCGADILVEVRHKTTINVVQTVTLIIMLVLLAYAGHQFIQHKPLIINYAQDESDK